MIRPLLARLGNLATIRVGDSTWNRARRPWNVTRVAPPKLLPTIVIHAPARARRGLTDTIHGRGLNCWELIARPSGVVTVTWPIRACFGTRATIEVGEIRTKCALRPAKRTLDVADRFVPLMRTRVRAMARPGERDVITGRGLNGVALEAVPPGVTRVSSPAAAPPGTTAVTRVADVTLKPFAAVPSNSTAFVPSRFVPVIVTCVPALPLPGENEAIPGSGLKLSVLQPRPFAVVTPIVPTAAVGGTVAVISDGESTVKSVASVPENLTAVASVKFAPRIVTFAPARAWLGLKERITGAVVNS